MPGPDPVPSRGTAKRLRQRGQVLAIFAGAMVLFVGILAIVVDISWYWSNTLKVQRAADAAALAGVVWLPGQASQAYVTADNEAAKNGYTIGTPGVTINTIQDSLAVGNGDPRQLDVTISAPVSTFFMRLFGITKIILRRDSKALYVQPVPMGSPLNYYGVYLQGRGLYHRLQRSARRDGPQHPCVPGVLRCDRGPGQRSQHGGRLRHWLQLGSRRQHVGQLRRPDPAAVRPARIRLPDRGAGRRHCLRLRPDVLRDVFRTRVATKGPAITG